MCVPSLRSVPSLEHLHSRKRKAVDVSTSVPAVTTPPKRRRIPITIVEPDGDPRSATPKVTSTLASDTGLLTAVSSRSLSKSPSPPSAVPQPPLQSPFAAVPMLDASTASKPASQTFREAKAAREELKPKGGIFRWDGGSSLFYTPGPSNVNTNVPKREIPETLIAFTRIWNELATEEERWDILRVGNVPIVTGRPTYTSHAANTCNAATHTI